MVASSRLFAPLVLALGLQACAESAPTPPAGDVGLQALATPGALLARFDSVSVFGNACWDAGSQTGCVGAMRGRIGRVAQSFLFYAVSQCHGGGDSLRAVLAVVDSAPPDTLPPDTLPPDTLPPDTLPDTLPPDTVPPDTLPPRVCVEAEVGFGEIPLGDIRGAGILRLLVETNTSARANPRFTRVVGQGGRVSVEWHRLLVPDSLPPDSLPPSDSLNVGRFVLRGAPFQGVWPARVAGTVAGFRIINPVFAQIGRSGGVTLTAGR
jgi:hypothetical protein